jgi:hypothetical protein
MAVKVGKFTVIKANISWLYNHKALKVKKIITIKIAKNGKVGKKL